MTTKFVRALTGVALASLAQVGFAAMITFNANLDGAQETPNPIVTAATGTSSVVLDTVAHTLEVNVDFSGIEGGPIEAAHIHCCAAAGNPAGVAVGLSGFPNTASDSYSNTFDLTLDSIYNTNFLTNNGGTAAGAEAALTAALLAGLTYVNLHNGVNPTGEIRGQLIAPPAPAPVPATLALLAAGLLAWRRRH